MDYGYESYDTTLSGLLGGFTFLFIILGIIIIAAIVVGAIAYWKLFKKAGRKGWESIVPFYSYWVLVEIAGLNWWWFLLIISSNIVSILGLEDLEGIASLVNLFASFNCYYNIAKKFNKSKGYSICAGIFSFIFMLILGFSKKETYDMSAPVSKNGIFGSPEVPVNNNNSYQNNTSQQNNYSGMNNNNIEPASDNNSQNISNELNNTNSTSQESSFCGNCGTKLSSGTKFCPNCGKQIN